MKRPMFIFVLGLTAALVAVVNAASVNATVAVTTYHYDNLRTGWNSSETILTAASFPSKFGVLATVLDARSSRNHSSFQVHRSRTAVLPRMTSFMS